MGSTASTPVAHLAVCRLETDRHVFGSILPKQVAKDLELKCVLTVAPAEDVLILEVAERRGALGRLDDDERFIGDAQTVRGARFKARNFRRYHLDVKLGTDELGRSELLAGLIAGAEVLLGRRGACALRKQTMGHHLRTGLR